MKEKIEKQLIEKVMKKMDYVGVESTRFEYLLLNLIKKAQEEERKNILKRINKRFPEDSTPFEVYKIINLIKQDL